MPLVVPQVNENDQASWAAKLLGKKITDTTSDEMVRALAPFSLIVIKDDESNIYYV